jgi:hypothetical protein
MVVVAAMAVMLIGATALASEDAFATKKKGGYEKARQQLKQTTVTMVSFH